MTSRNLAKEAGPSLLQVALTGEWPSKESIEAWDNWFQSEYDRAMPKRPREVESPIPVPAGEKDPAKSGWVVRFSKFGAGDALYHGDETDPEKFGSGDKYCYTQEPEPEMEQDEDGVYMEIPKFGTEQFDSGVTNWGKLVDDTAKMGLNDKTAFATVGRSLLPFEPTDDLAAGPGRWFRNDHRVVVVHTTPDTAVCSCHVTGQTVLISTDHPYRPYVGSPFRFVPSQVDRVFTMGDELAVPVVSVLNRQCAFADVVEGVRGFQQQMEQVGYGLMVGLTPVTDRPIIRTTLPNSPVVRVMGPPRSVGPAFINNTVAFRYSQPLEGKDAVIAATPLSPYCGEQMIRIRSQDAQWEPNRMVGFCETQGIAVEVPRVALSRAPSTPLRAWADLERNNAKVFHEEFLGYEMICRTCPNIPMGVSDDGNRPIRRVSEICRYMRPTSQSGKRRLEEVNGILSTAE
jgi:hypothetical protein